MSIFPTKIMLFTDGSEDAELAATTAVGLAGSLAPSCMSSMSKQRARRAVSSTST